MNQELEARILRLEDIESIRQLKARYCFLCDDGYDADGLAELFVEEAVWDGGDLGRAEGRDRIRRFFERSPSALSFAVHMVMNPLIEVDGDEATGVWYLYQAATLVEGSQPLWGSARYDERYRRESDGWKFVSLELTSFFWTPFEEGWERRRSVFER